MQSHHPTKPWLSARTGDPKGFAPYRPTAAWKLGVVDDVLELFAELEADDATPVGPRTVGYALSQRANPSGLRYVKRLDKAGNIEHRDGVVGFKPVENAIKRLRQAEKLPWHFVSDGSAVSHPVSEDTSAEGFAARVLDGYEHDLRVDQPLVVELHSESAELTAFLERVAAPYGVRVESGRGSGGPDLARDVAIRAWNRWNAEPGQKTLVLGIGDLDLDGIRGVMRPHIEHIGRFLVGLAERHSDWDPETRLWAAGQMLDFRRVAVTVEQAIELELEDVDREALLAYGASGTDDWARDVQFLDGTKAQRARRKVEVEALGPQRLRAAVTEAIESALDLDLLERAHVFQRLQQERVREMRQTLGLEDE